MKLRLLGQHPQAQIQYDNIDYSEGRRHQTMSAKPEQKAATTGRVYINPFVPEQGLNQNHIDYSARLTYGDILSAPGVHNDSDWESSCRYWITHALEETFAISKYPNWSKVGASIGAVWNFPYIERLPAAKTVCHALFPLHFNEGTIEGTDAIHTAIFRDQFGIPEDDIRYSERLWLLYGDQKTVKLSASVQLDREENESAFERRKWLQPVVSIFHWAQNRLWAIQKAYTGPVNNSITASLAHNMQYRKIVKVPLEQAPYHELKEVVFQAWNARIVALLLVQLEAEGVDVSNISQINAHLKSRQPEDTIRYISWIYNIAFAAQAYGNGYPPANTPQDDEFLLLVRFLQDVMPVKNMLYASKHGDIGWVERCFNRSIVQCLGTGGTNYAREMLFMVWLLRKGTRSNDIVRKAILAGGLVNIRGLEDSWQPIDHHGELLNLVVKTWMKEQANSSFNFKTCLSRCLPLVDWWHDWHRKLEDSLGIRVNAAHTAVDLSGDNYSLGREISAHSGRLHAEGRRLTSFKLPNINQVGANALRAAIARFNERMDEDFSGVDMPMPDVVADQEGLESTIGNDGIVRASSPEFAPDDLDDYLMVAFDD
jgi:hypothetical protein